MAGYRTVDELMDILEEECLEFDAVVSIVGGNNKYDYQIITVPKKNVHIKKDGAYIDMQGLDQPFFFPNSEVSCGFKNAVFYLTKDGDSFFVSACFLDEKDLKLNEDEQLRTIDRNCIAEFLDKKGINTRGKLLKILKDGYQMYKNNLGIEDEFELQRDSFLADMDEDQFFSYQNGRPH